MSALRSCQENISFMCELSDLCRMQLHQISRWSEASVQSSTSCSSISLVWAGRKPRFKDQGKPLHTLVRFQSWQGEDKSLGYIIGYINLLSKVKQPLTRINSSPGDFWTVNHWKFGKSSRAVSLHFPLLPFSIAIGYWHCWRQDTELFRPFFWAITANFYY